MTITIRHVDGHTFANTIARKDNSVFERIRYLLPGEIHKEEHLVALKGRKVVGVMGLEANPWNERCFWVKFVSVDPAHQKQGVARQLLDALMPLLRERGVDAELSTYTAKGRSALAPIVARLKTANPDLTITESTQPDFS